MNIIIITRNVCLQYNLAEPKLLAMYDTDSLQFFVVDKIKKSYCSNLSE